MHVVLNKAYGRGDSVTRGQTIGTVGVDGTVGNNGIAHIHYELHSEPAAGPKGYAEFFDQQDDREQAHGSYVAPFAGVHGWFWENRTDRELTVRLTTSGFYSGSLEFRRAQPVKRKTF